jgi:hypothetical protein
VEDGCKAEKEGSKQWGEWLRALPRKIKRGPPPARPLVSSGSYSGCSGDSGICFGGGMSIRDIPPRRNLAFDYSYLGSSHTGENERHKGKSEVMSPIKVRGRMQWSRTGVQRSEETYG